MINERHATDKLTEGDVEIFERFSANDQLMRRPLRFTKRALEKFARDFTDGRTVLLDHDESKPIGKTFAADVVSERVRGVEGNWLRTRFYVVTKGAGEARRQDIEDIRSGVRSFDSITLFGGKWEMQEVEGPDGEARYFFEIDDDEGAWPRLEAWELSLVYLGAVYGAGSEKGAGLRAALAPPLRGGDRPASDPWGKYTLGEPEPEEPDPYKGRLVGAMPGKPEPEKEDRPESLAVDPNDPYAGRLKR